MSTITNKVEFEVERDGKVTKYVLIKPNRRETSDAEAEYNKYYTKLFREGHLLEEEVRTFLVARGLWDTDKDDELKAIDKEIKRNTKIFLGQTKNPETGLDTTLAERRKAAIDCRKLYIKRILLRSKWRDLEDKTAGSQAGNHKFLYLIVKCTKDERGQPVFKSVDDLLNRADDDAVVAKATEAMTRFEYGVEPDWWVQRADNAWLVANKFADAEGRLIGKDGGFVDEEGNPVNDKGQRIDPLTKHLLDADGEPVDEKGLPIGETFPALGVKATGEVAA